MPILSDEQMAALEAEEAPKQVLSDDDMAALEAEHAQQAPALAPSTPIQSFVEGVGQTASMGYLPQLQTGAELGINKLSEFLGVGPSGQDVALRAQGFSVPEESYVQSRDANIARQAAQAQTDPVASSLGKGVGLVAGGTALPFGPASQGVRTAGQAVLQGAKSGALMGAVANPGDTAGEVSPLQLGDRAVNTAIGGSLGGFLSGAGAGIKNLADKSRMVDRVKDSAGLSSSVKAEIDAARQGVRDNYIAPRGQEVRRLQEGQFSEINPDLLKSVAPGLASRMSKNVEENGRRLLPDAKADRLRQFLDAKAKYSSSQPFDTTSVAKGEGAKKAADILRKQINAKPGVGPLKDEMANAYRLSNSLKKKSASSPIAAIKSKPGTDKGSLIDAIDKMSGSELEKHSNQITEASGLIMKPSNFFKPLEALNETKKVGIRAAAGAARGVEALTPEISQEAFIRAILEAKR